MSVFHGLSGGRIVQLVDTPVGVAVGRGDAVGAGRGVGVGTTCVGVGGTADGVAVGFGVRVGVGVSVGFGVRVGVGVRVGLRVGVGVGVRVGLRVGVGVAVRVGRRVGVGVGITDTSAATSPPAKSNTMPDAIPAARPREILMRRSRASLIPRSRTRGALQNPGFQRAELLRPCRNPSPEASDSRRVLRSHLPGEAPMQLATDHDLDCSALSGNLHRWTGVAVGQAEIHRSFPDPQAADLQLRHGVRHRRSLEYDAPREPVDRQAEKRL
jgi:hypothetical protein